MAKSGWTACSSCVAILSPFISDRLSWKHDALPRRLLTDDSTEGCHDLWCLGLEWKQHCVNTNQTKLREKKRKMQCNLMHTEATPGSASTCVKTTCKCFGKMFLARSAFPAHHFTQPSFLTLLLSSKAEQRHKRRAKCCTPAFHRAMSK